MAAAAKDFRIPPKKIAGMRIKKEEWKSFLAKISKAEQGMDIDELLAEAKNELDKAFKRHFLRDIDAGPHVN